MIPAYEQSAIVATAPKWLIRPRFAGGAEFAMASAGTTCYRPADPSA